MDNDEERAEWEASDRTSWVARSWFSGIGGSYEEPKPEMSHVTTPYAEVGYSDTTGAGEGGRLPSDPEFWPSDMCARCHTCPRTGGPAATAVLCSHCALEFREMADQVVVEMTDRWQMIALAGSVADDDAALRRL